MFSVLVLALCSLTVGVFTAPTPPAGASCKEVRKWAAKTCLQPGDCDPTPIRCFDKATGSSLTVDPYQVGGGSLTTASVGPISLEDMVGETKAKKPKRRPEQELAARAAEARQAAATRARAETQQAEQHLGQVQTRIEGAPTNVITISGTSANEVTFAGDSVIIDGKSYYLQPGSRIEYTGSRGKGSIERVGNRFVPHNMKLVF